MNPILRQVMEDLKSDATHAVAEAFGRLVAGYFSSACAGAGRVSTALTPAQIAARFREALPESGRPIAEVIARLERDLLPDSNHLCHPRSMGHQVSAPLPAAVWTEALTGALNQSAAVWEMSPVGTVIEAQVVHWMCQLAGFGLGAGGTFTSGGTEATFAALLAARQAALPDVWQKGIGSNRPLVICGEHSHYSVARAVGELGLGTDNLMTVPSCDYRMDVDSLENLLNGMRAERRQVMAVVATAGTTATGSFDNLKAIGRLCADRGFWFHVDGAHGASALLSPFHRRRLAGIEHARSISWDPHKMMLVPLSAGMLLVRDERDLEAAFSQSAPYLFHAADTERSWDQGTRSFQCSRRLDALKVWVALQRYGAAGLGALYDHLCASAQLLYEAVCGRRDFRACHVPESNILCFRYIGDGTVDEERLDSLNQSLRTSYNRSGEGWITTTKLGGHRVLRVVLMNPHTSSIDLEHVLDGLAETGGRLLSR